MKFSNINLDELRTEAEADIKTTVRDALKGLVGGLDQAIEVADDPDELVELIKLVTEQLKSGRRNIRDRKPIAELTAGGTTTNDPGLSPEELQLIIDIRSRFGGDLISALEYMRQQKAERDDLERQLNERTRELNAARANTNTVDHGQATRIRELEAELGQANQHLTKANEDLALAQAQLAVTPKDLKDLVEVLKAKGSVAPRRIGRKDFFRIDLDELSDDQLKLLDV